MRHQALVALLLAGLTMPASACSYYFAEDDDAPSDDGISDDGVGDDAPDDGDDVALPDAGPAEPDASPVCDPSAILPDGYAPVAVVSTGTVVNTPDEELPGVFTTVIDASAGGAAEQANQPFVYLDLEAEGGAAAVAIDDVASFQSADWDIALKRFVIRANSGDSGPGDEEVATVMSEDLGTGTDVPSESFADDDWTGDGCSLVRDNTGGPRTRFSNWYQVQAGRFEARPVTHIVRLGGGQYAEIDVVTYYGDEADPDRSGVYVLRWRRFP
jgi:hypothetical protein